MSNPFKAGDKVVALASGYSITPGGLYTVLNVMDTVIEFLDDDGDHRQQYYACYRAAVAGKDYKHEPIPANTGHMPDGSGIQQHSAGGHYPYVLVYRDKKQYCDEFGRYDVGVIGPQSQTPLWFKSLNHAVRVVESMKGNEA